MKRARGDPAESYLGLARILGVLFVLPLAATIAFMAVEGWGFFDALYMAVITLTTVGFHEVHPLDTGGRIVVIVYLTLGLGAFFFGVVRVGEIAIGMQLGGLREKRKMKEILDKMSGHVVVCGYGRVGRRLCRELHDAGQEFVVIDRDAPAIGELQAAGQPALCGDATDDAVLEAAGLARARGLAAVLPSDADNLYVVLSGRQVNGGLQIMARATDEKAVAKLQRAGANHAINLYETSAIRMARLLTHPELEDFMQIFTSQGGALTLAEIAVKEDAAFCGQTLRETDLSARGILVVGHQKPGGRVVVPPRPTERIEPGDTLFAFGDAARMGEILGPR
ncbi:MAG: potassium channel protein [Planctomycetota bacterium]